MKKRAYKTELQDAIQLLEAEKGVKLELMKDQFHQITANLHPANLIQNTLKEISSSPYLVDNLLSGGVGLVTGFLSKKIVVGGSNNIFKRVLGNVLQFGVTNLIAQNPKAIWSIGQYISQRFFNKEK